MGKSKSLAQKIAALSEPSPTGLFGILIFINKSFLNLNRL